MCRIDVPSNNIAFIKIVFALYLLLLESLMNEIQELFADIRNKLQGFKTVVEAIRSKKILDNRLIQITLKDLEDIEFLFNDYEIKLRKEDT